MLNAGHVERGDTGRPIRPPPPPVTRRAMVSEVHCQDFIELACSKVRAAAESNLQKLPISQPSGEE